jgi:hypothetical protein
MLSNNSLSRLYGSLHNDVPYPGKDAIRKQVAADLAQRLQSKPNSQISGLSEVETHGSDPINQPKGS